MARTPFVRFESTQTQEEGWIVLANFHNFWEQA